MLRGTIRDHIPGPRQPMLRFFACEQDLSHELPDAPLPDATAAWGGVLFHRRSLGRRLGNARTVQLLRTCCGPVWHDRTTKIG